MRLFPLFNSILRTALDADGKKIVNLGTPTQDTDAATKKYVDENGGGDVIGKLPMRPLPKYLHFLPFDDAYPADAAWLYAQLGPSDLGRCSAVRRGGKLWRNYDWTFDDAAEFVVKMSGSATRFASVGVASVGSRLTENDVMSAVNSRYYKCIPGMTLDGINEKGVVCEINVDGGPKDGWHGDAEDDGIHILAAVRWVLDHGETAAQAAEWIADHIIQPQGEMNFHFMVADATKTYIVENGEAHAVTEGVKVLTNYAIYDEAHAGGGKERYTLLAGGADISAVNFTNAYKSGNTWHSDFESAEQHAEAIAQWAAQGTDKEAHRGKTTSSGKAWWQSVHTTEYDFAAKTMKVAVQEVDDWYIFAVDQANVDLSPIEEQIAALQSGKRDLTDEKAYKLGVSPEGPWTWTSDNAQLVAELNATGSKPVWDSDEEIWRIAPGVASFVFVRADSEGVDSPQVSCFFEDESSAVYHSVRADATRPDDAGVVEDLAHRLAKRAANPTFGSLAKFDADGNLVNASAGTDFVAPVSGKGLSANDYTDADKAEVAKVKFKADEFSAWEYDKPNVEIELVELGEGTDKYWTWRPKAGGMPQGTLDSSELHWDAIYSSYGVDFTATRRRVLRTGDAATPQELTAAVSTNNPAFVSAVRNTPTENIPEDMPTDWGTYGTVGAALAALAAFVKWAKAKIVAVIGDDGKPTDQFATDLLGKQVANAKVRYALATTSSAAMADRTVNLYEMNGNGTITFPTATTHEGVTYARDFLLRVKVTTAGSLTLPTDVTPLGDSFDFTKANDWLIAFTEIGKDANNKAEFYIRAISLEG